MPAPQDWRNHYRRMKVQGPGGSEVYLFEQQGQHFAYDVNGMASVPVSARQAELLRGVDAETLALQGAAEAGSDPEANALRELIAEGELFSPFKALESTWEPVNTVFIYTTNACNLDCPYCYREYNTRKLSFECACRIIDEAAQKLPSNGGPRQLKVRFIGGEPLMNIALIDKLCSHYNARSVLDGIRYSFSVVTNGTLLTRHHVDVLWAHQVMVTVTFGGVDADTHDAARPAMKGEWSPYGVLRDNLPYLFQVYGAANVWANNTITKDFYDYWAIFEHAVSLGFTRVKMNHVQDSWDSAFSWEMLPLVAEKRHEFMRRYLEYLLDGGRAVLFRIQKWAGMLADRDHSIVPGPCGTNTIVAFNTDGNLYNCQRFIGMPAYRTGTLADGFAPERVQPFIDNNVDSKMNCSQCWAKYMCGGSCPHAAGELRGTQDVGESLDGWDEYCQRTYHEWEAMIWFYNELGVRAPEVLEWFVHGHAGDHDNDRIVDLFMLRPSERAEGV